MPPEFYKSKFQECTFEIVAKDLDPEKVSILFRVEPDRVVRCGDKSAGRTLHAQGAWVVSSRSRVSTIKPDEHLGSIVTFAIEHKNEIEELRKMIDVKIGIRFLWEFEDRTVVFGLERDALSNLASIVDWIGFSIT